MNKSKSTQNFVPIKEIRKGTAILKDGSMRAVLMISSTNFALKSDDEQKAMLTQFQNFLNSLDFTIQISVESRELDIRPYIALLEEQYKKQTKELLKIQTREYIEFIKDFMNSVNVMSKNFFIVIPYTPSGFGETGGKIRSFFSGLFGGGGEKKQQQKEDSSFEEKRTQLEQRISVVAGGAASMGLDTAKLENEELIELFYKKFNPGAREKPAQLKDKDKQ